VDTILWENEYDVVERPAAGDVIVYRDGTGHVVHTGIVRFAQDDLVVVESKWGGRGRYLHQPLDQAYSTSFQYYHSPRPGNLIQVDNGPPAELRQSPS